MNDKTLVYVQSLIQHLTEGLKQTGTVAWHTYLAVTQVNCIVQLVESISWILSFLIAFFIARHIRLSFEYNEDFSTECSFLFILQYVFLTAAILTFLINMFDVWNWIGIFNPQLYIAHDIINTVIYKVNNR